MPVAGPWYFAWVDEGTEFDPDVHNVMNEYILSLKRTLKEGDKPTLEMVIRNPHIGLLNGSRKQWAWLSRDTGATAGIVPVFYGRLVAAPKDIFKETLTINLVAWPIDYYKQRQILAEEIKENGPYDPVFIDVPKRDDPDTLLEAVSGLYHIDPVTHVVTISDIIDGEDGNVDVTADDHLYDDFNADWDQATTLTAILMVATVTWNQTGTGFIDMGPQTISTFAGDAVISEWPKPLTQLGGGYTVAFANAFDAAHVNATVSATATVNWKNREKFHSDGDTLTVNQSLTRPVGMGAGALSVLATYVNQTGFLDPYATDGNGDPSPTNIPPHMEVSWIFCPLWVIKTSLTLSYRDLDRRRVERLQMLLDSDLQAIIVNPEVQQNSEVITKDGADIGIPIIRLLAWTTVMGQAVTEDTVIFPDHPKLPSQRTAQICVTPGTAGTDVPNFSDVPGATTNDGSVVWASLGTPAPTETAFDWPASTNVGLGTIILPRRPMFITYEQLTVAGTQQFPRTGTQVSLGQYIFGGGAYHYCSLPGLTRVASPPSFSTTRGAVTTDGSVSWTCIGSQLPDGRTHFLCVGAGQTGARFLIPQFNTTLHAHTTDNGVTWSAIGPGDIPAGGTPGDIWARSYFDTTRGNQSIQYLISIMRARARMKARAVKIDFTPTDAFGLGLLLTCRKTVTLHDTRLGNGLAVGKVIMVEHSCDGHTGRELCRAQIGCAIGKDNAVEVDEGAETYVEGYVDGYRYQENVIRVLDDNDDVGYTPPAFATNDDGLTFPLTKAEVTISEAVRSGGDQQGAVLSALYSMAAAANLGLMAGASSNIDYSASLQGKIVQLSGNSVSAATALNPIWYDAALKPLSGWTFNNSYNVTLTKLVCARGVDLEAASTP